MNAEHLPWLAAAVLIVAFLYSSVGHAGASGYLAIMSLFSLAPGVMKPTALVLNIVVASISTWQFWRSGHFSWEIFWPFALLAVPCAFAGGYIDLPTSTFRLLVGIILLFSAVRFFVNPAPDSPTSPPARALAIPAGGVLGFVAGLTGTGGGIFLTPLLLLMRWAPTKTAAGVSAPFILVNSAAGLLGNLSSVRSIPALAGALTLAAVVGGLGGSYLGSRRLPPIAIKRLLAVVLLIAGTKLILVR